VLPRLATGVAESSPDAILPRLPPASKAVEATHQILKSIVAAAINEVPELQRFVNLKSEIIAHAAVTLDK
jgi:hypothetical protein